MTEKTASFWRNISGRTFLIVLSQIWECYSYFGLRAILVLFLTSIEIGYTDKKAFGIYLVMVAMADVLSVASGRLGDSKIGNAKVAIWGAFLLALGFFLVGRPFSALTFYTGVSCLSAGVALYRPNCFALIGACMHTNALEATNGNLKAAKARVDSGMALVYGLIDIGFVLAYLVAGSTMEYLGWYYALTTISWSMVIACVFVACYKLAEFKNKLQFLKWLFDWEALKLVLTAITLVGFCGFCVLNYTIATLIIICCIILVLAYLLWLIIRLHNSHRNAIGAFIVYLILLTAFIAIERQIFTALPLFFSRNINRMVFDYVVPVTSIYVVMPVSVIGLGPLNAYFLHKWHSNSLLPGIRGILAFFCFTMCYLCMTIGCHTADNAGMAALLWPTAGIVFLAFANSIFIPSILGMASRVAPKDRRGVFTGMIFVWVAIGTIIANPLSSMLAISNNQSINPLESILVYKSGFTTLTIISACFTFVALAVKILLDRIVNVYYNEV